jgi:6-phosphofructokinase 1
VIQHRFGHMVTWQNGRLGHIALQDVAQQHRSVPLNHPLLHLARQIGVSLGSA